MEIDTANQFKTFNPTINTKIFNENSQNASNKNRISQQPSGRRTKGRLRKHQRYLDANNSHNTTIRLKKENQGQHQYPSWIQQRHP